MFIPFADKYGIMTDKSTILTDSETFCASNNDDADESKEGTGIPERCWRRYV